MPTWPNVCFGVAYSFPAYLSNLYRNVFRNDLGSINASGTWRLPIPARYVIDRNGTIVDAEVNPDYRYRPDPEATLAVVAALTSSARVLITGGGIASLDFHVAALT